MGGIKMGLTGLKCPRCSSEVRQEDSRDSHAFCDGCKEFVYVGDQFWMVDDLRRSVLKKKAK
jgi:hypothetical protein